MHFKKAGSVVQCVKKGAILEERIFIYVMIYEFNIQLNTQTTGCGGDPPPPKPPLIWNHTSKSIEATMQKALQFLYLHITAIFILTYHKTTTL